MSCIICELPHVFTQKVLKKLVNIAFHIPSLFLIRNRCPNKIRYYIFQVEEGILRKLMIIWNQNNFTASSNILNFQAMATWFLYASVSLNPSSCNKVLPDSLKRIKYWTRTCVFKFFFFFNYNKITETHAVVTRSNKKEWKVFNTSPFAFGTSIASV